MRQLIRRTEGILTLPEEKNKSEYGEMYGWLTKALNQLLPNEAGWKAKDAQSA